MFIIDYDIDMKQRRKFYYHLVKLKKEHETIKSSFSVLTTDDKELAEEIYELATKYGKASLYEGELLKSNNHV